MKDQKEIFKEAIEKIKDKKGFSETFPEMSIGEIMETIPIEKWICHDWRGFAPEWNEEEGWLRYLYISNKYLWVLQISTDADGEVEAIKLEKFDAGQLDLRPDKDTLVFKCLKRLIWERDDF